MQPLVVVSVDEPSYLLPCILDANEASSTETFPTERLEVCLDLPVRLWIRYRGPYLLQSGISNELCKVLRYKLRAIVGDYPWVHPGVLLLGPLQG